LTVVCLSASCFSQLTAADAIARAKTYCTALEVPFDSNGAGARQTGQGANAKWMVIDKDSIIALDLAGKLRVLEVSSRSQRMRRRIGSPATLAVASDAALWSKAGAFLQKAAAQNFAQRSAIRVRSLDFPVRVYAAFLTASATIGAGSISTDLSISEPVLP